MADDDYRFMQVVDAWTCINQQVNLVGVFLGTSICKSTKGTDYFCSLKVVDGSLPEGICINFFGERMNLLPHPESIGDIVLVTQVKIKIHDDAPMAEFSKKLSSFALFRGKGSSYIPYQSSIRYRPAREDRRFVNKLREWVMGTNMEEFDESLLLRQIKVEERINLLGKVLHISEVKDKDWVLFVWDGTDTPPAPVVAKLEDEKENQLPLQYESSPLSRDILCTFPTVGSVLRISIDPFAPKLGTQYLKENRWVKFIEVDIEVGCALWRAKITGHSMFCYLPDDNKLVTDRMRSFDERIQSHWGKMPYSCFPWPTRMTETDYPDAAPKTLMDILTHPEVTYKFKTIVRIVAILPWRPEDFTSRSGIFRVRLTLEDPTARIHAFVYAEDGVKFFGDIFSLDVRMEKRNALLGIYEEAVDNIPRYPPWIQCCIKSYYVDSADQWGSRNYRIFDTHVLD